MRTRSLDKKHSRKPGHHDPTDGHRDLAEFPDPILPTSALSSCGFLGTTLIHSVWSVLELKFRDADTITKRLGKRMLGPPPALGTGEARRARLRRQA